MVPLPYYKFSASFISFIIIFLLKPLKELKHARDIISISHYSLHSIVTLFNIKINLITGRRIEFLLGSVLKIVIFYSFRNHSNVNDSQCNNSFARNKYCLEFDTLIYRLENVFIYTSILPCPYPQQFAIQIVAIEINYPRCIHDIVDP